MIDISSATTASDSESSDSTTSEIAIIDDSTGKTSARMRKRKTPLSLSGDKQQILTNVCSEKNALTSKKIKVSRQNAEGHLVEKLPTLQYVDPIDSDKILITLTDVNSSIDYYIGCKEPLSVIYEHFKMDKAIKLCHNNIFVSKYSSLSSLKYVGVPEFVIDGEVFPIKPSQTEFMVVVNSSSSNSTTLVLDVNATNKEILNMAELVLTSKFNTVIFNGWLLDLSERLDKYLENMDVVDLIYLPFNGLAVKRGVLKKK